MKKPPYDFWLHWYLSERCYMTCSYCGEWQQGDLALKPISTIDIPKLISTLDRTGLVFRVSFTGGGEPFLVPNLTEACLELTNRHYVSFNTNLAEPQVRGFLERVDPSRVVEIHASCHLKSLERRKLMDRFVDNCLLCQRRNIPLTIVEVGYPPLLAEVEKYKAFFQSKGLNLHFGVFCGNWNGKNYPQAYTEAELIGFGLNDTSRVTHAPNSAGRRIICNASCTTAIARPNGSIAPCDDVEGDMGNLYREIRIRKHIMLCPAAWCTCPRYEYDRALYLETLRRDRLYVSLLRPMLRINAKLNNRSWYVRFKKLCRAARN